MASSPGNKTLRPAVGRSWIILKVIRSAPLTHGAGTEENGGADREGPECARPAFTGRIPAPAQGEDRRASTPVLSLRSN